MKNIIFKLKCLILFTSLFNLFVTLIFCDNSTKKEIEMFLKVNEVNILNTVVKNISDNIENYEIYFGSFSEIIRDPWNKLAEQYISISIESNAPFWRLRIYSDNFSTCPPNVNIWGYQYGGLIGSDEGAKIPVAWQCFDTLIENGITPGDPAMQIENGWTYLKDKSDIDIPGNEYNESFLEADNVGYCNIAFGGAGYTKIINPKIGYVDLPKPNSQFYLYFEANLAYAPSSSYVGKLVIELLNR